MITRVEAVAFKGRTFSQPLRPMTVIVGPNNSGKTAVVDAIRLALLGHIPGHPKTAKGIFALASASNMSVTAYLGSDAVTRSWHQKGKSVAGLEQGASKVPPFPLAMLDAEAYFGASEAARTALVFGLVDLSRMGFAPQELEKQLVKMASTALPTLQAAITAAKESSASPQEWIDAVSAALQESQKGLNMEIGRLEKTAQGLVHLAQGETLLDAGQIAAAIERTSKARDEARTTIAQLSERLGFSGVQAAMNAKASALEAKLADQPEPKPLDALQAERDALTADFTAAANALIEIKAALAAWDRDQKRAEEIRRQLAGLPVVESKSKRATAISALEQALRRPAPDTKESERQLQTARDVVTTLRAEYVAKEKARKDCVEKWDRLNRENNCPVCGRAFEGLLAELEKQEMTPIRQALQNLETEGKAAKARYDAAEGDHTKKCQAAKDRAEVEKRLAAEKAAALADQVTEERRVELQTQLDKANETLQGPQPDLTGAQQRHTAAQTALAENERLMEIARSYKDLAEIRATLSQSAPPGSQVTLDLTKEDLTKLELDLSTLRQQERRAQAQAGDSRRAAQAQTEVAEKKTQRDAVKAMVKSLGETREKLVAAAFGPLLSTANQFTRDVLPTPLEFHEGEIGRWEGTSWIPVRAFGGAHGAISYAGIQAALAVQSGVRLVVVDELGRFDPNSLKTFLRNTAEAVLAGQLEQFIGIDVDPSRYTESEGLLLVKTGAK